ncbi:MAG: PepSY domain-containing protein [Nevskiales bacterium]
MTTRKRRLAHYLRSLYSWHRWLGIVSAVFVLLLASTGLALNHTDGWKLNQRAAPRWLHSYYGMAVPPPEQGLTLDGHWFTAYEGWLYYDASAVTQAGAALGVSRVFDAYVVATDRGMVGVGGDDHPSAEPGQLIDVLPYEGVSGRPLAFAESPDKYYLETTAGLFSTPLRGDAPQWSRETGQMPDRAQQQALPADLAQTLQHDAQGRALNWERVLLDLHSGRMFGAYGELLMDAAALLFVVLALSGITLWLRFTWRQRRRRHRQA